MISKTVTIQNKTGLHARPVADFAKLAMKMPCDVFLEKDGRKVCGKSVLALLTLGATKGQMVDVITDGDSESDALSKLVSFIEQLED